MTDSRLGALEPPRRVEGQRRQRQGARQRAPRGGRAPRTARRTGTPVQPDEGQAASSPDVEVEPDPGHLPAARPLGREAADGDVTPRPKHPERQHTRRSQSRGVEPVGRRWASARPPIRRRTSPTRCPASTAPQAFTMAAAIRPGSSGAQRRSSHWWNLSGSGAGRPGSRGRSRSRAAKSAAGHRGGPRAGAPDGRRHVAAGRASAGFCTRTVGVPRVHSEPRSVRGTLRPVPRAPPATLRQRLPRPASFLSKRHAEDYSARLGTPPVRPRPGLSRASGLPNIPHGFFSGLRDADCPNRPENRGAAGRQRSRGREVACGRLTSKISRRRASLTTIGCRSRRPSSATLPFSRCHVVPLDAPQAPWHRGRRHADRRDRRTRRWLGARPPGVRTRQPLSPRRRTAGPAAEVHRPSDGKTGCPRHRDGGGTHRTRTTRGSGRPRPEPGQVSPATPPAISSPAWRPTRIAPPRGRRRPSGRRAPSPTPSGPRADRQRHRFLLLRARGGRAHGTPGGLGTPARGPGQRLRHRGASAEVSGPAR